jgi:transposase-like protein
MGAYLYRAVATHSQTPDLRLTASPHERATKHLLTKAIHRHDVSEKVTMTGFTTSGNRPHRNATGP